MLFTQSSATPLIRGLSIVSFNILSSNVSEVVFKLKTPAAYFVSLTQFVTSLNNSVNPMDVDLFDLNPKNPGNILFSYKCTPSIKYFWIIVGVEKWVCNLWTTTYMCCYWIFTYYLWLIKVLTLTGCQRFLQAFVPSTSMALRGAGAISLPPSSRQK